MIPLTQLDIVNQVLNLIARTAVDNVNESPQAILINQRYPNLLKNLLRKAIWNFAIAFKSDNTPLTTTVSNEFLFNYQLPANYGRFWRMEAQSTPTFGFVYQIVDNIFMTNANPINYWYVVNYVDASVIPPPFEQALVYYIASQVCLSLTQNKQLSDELKFEFINTYLPDAIQQVAYEQMIIQTAFNDFDRQSYI